jgi:hypothetical protein
MIDPGGEVSAEGLRAFLDGGRWRTYPEQKKDFHHFKNFPLLRHVIPN